MKRGILDDRSLELVKKEFDRLKESNDYQNYTIGEYIDSGGYARVYAVNPLHGEKGKKYALRIADVNTDENDGKNERETEAVKKLMAFGQKHIVNYLMSFTVETTYGEESHTLYCTLMPFLCPLSKNKTKTDDIEIALRLGNDLLPLLQTCMEKQIIHRDIKSQNILYDGDFRNDEGFLLGDFGEARNDNDGTVTGRGTLSTMAPEIIGFDKDIRHDHKLCDMYSLGLVMYYYLNDRTYPFGNAEKDHYARIDNKGALPPPKYGSAELKALIVKATQYYPKDRFASPGEMFTELKQCEEYRTFILGKVSPEEDTLNSHDELFKENKRLFDELREENSRMRDEWRAEIERIHLEFVEKEKRLQSQIDAMQEQIEQLKQQNASLSGAADLNETADSSVREPYGRREVDTMEDENREKAADEQIEESDALREESFSEEGEDDAVPDEAIEETEVLSEGSSSEKEDWKEDYDTVIMASDVLSKESPSAEVDRNATADKPMQEPYGRRKKSLSAEVDWDATPDKPIQEPYGRIVPVKSDQPLSVKAGERLLFGQYPQGANGEMAPLEWRVLDVRGSKALLITEKLIDYVPYNKEYISVTWESCSLRKWLNTDFVMKAFGTQKPPRVARSAIQNRDNQDYGTDGGNWTNDRIFALSIDEAEKYFTSDMGRVGHITDYVHSKENDGEDGSAFWWLRSPGSLSILAAGVNDDGSVSGYGKMVKLIKAAVRPALWLNLK